MPTEMRELALDDVDTRNFAEESRIGGGGFSIVYEGYWLGCKVAVKRWFDPRKAEEVEEEFHREAMMHANLCHPNIVQCLGVVRQPPELLMVTEYMRYSLDNVMYSSDSKVVAALTVEKALGIALQLVCAFRYLHQLIPAVVHRDLKPANILLDRLFKAKLCDFGLAGARIAQDGAGTAAYMAPELLDKKPFTKKADVYAFGVTLNEMIDKKRPFGQALPADVRTRVLAGERPALCSAASASPADARRIKEVQELVQKCWAADPLDRPTFEEIGAMSLFDGVVQ